jgi:hypothetical protein
VFLCHDPHDTDKNNLVPGHACTHSFTVRKRGNKDPSLSLPSTSCPLPTTDDPLLFPFLAKYRSR